MGCSFSYTNNTTRHSYTFHAHTPVEDTRDDARSRIHHRCVGGAHVEDHSVSPPMPIELDTWLEEDLEAFRHQLHIGPARLEPEDVRARFVRRRRRTGKAMTADEGRLWLQANYLRELDVENSSGSSSNEE